MISMGMVQVALDQIIDMIAVRHGFMSAIGTMDMAFGVAADVMVAGAFIRMLGIHFHNVIFNPAAFLMHQMTAFEIVRVPVMFNRRVPATGAMLMIF
ncbi:MAG: hypothetical protein JWR26_3368 [Pedosphaera sp.]|nr:hypothetical protein [Pedosphaera sp.]